MYYEHYIKPIASELKEQSAIPEKRRITQIAVKVLEKTSLELPWSRRAELFKPLGTMPGTDRT